MKEIVVTGAGVSAGIDMALTLVAEIAGPQVAQAIQLGIEYDPQPPYDAGAPSKARAASQVVAAARSGKAVNIKKGQFLSPYEVGPLGEKVRQSGNPNVYITERGTTV